jgi:very-short-patch-repair endonuclease
MIEATITAPREILRATYATLADLAELGISRREAARLIAAGRLVRLRRGRYCPAGLDPALVHAGRLGGRLDCVSLLAALGVFVTDVSGVHTQFDRTASRLPVRDRSVVAHWRDSAAASTALSAELIEALAQACRCQSPRDAIATLDSAWHIGLVDEPGIAEVFGLLPRRFRRLRALLDPRSESGPETLMRLMLRGIGCHVDVQVQIEGVGRVDLVVDGWLIVECDSHAHHEGWASQRHDRRRDLAAAALGYSTVRPVAEDIVYRHERTLKVMKTIVAQAASRRRRNSGTSSAARASAS